MSNGFGGGGSGIKEVTSTGATLVITNPNGPVVNEEVAAGSGTVNSVANSDGTLTISPTTGVVVASRAGITGDVIVAPTSNAAVLAGTAGVQSIIRTYRAALTGDVTASQDNNATTLVGTAAVQGIIRAYRAALIGDVTATQDTNTTVLADTVNVESLSRLASLQAKRKQLAASWDNVPFGLQKTCQVAAASNGVNVNTFAGSGTLNVTGCYVFDFVSPSGPRFGPSPQILQVQIVNGVFVQISYTGTTVSGNNITAFTGCTTLNSGAGLLATGINVYAAPQAIADVVVPADSLLYGNGSNIVDNYSLVGSSSTDWFTVLLGKENEQAGLPDPARGWRRCVSPFFSGDQWTGLQSATITNVTNVGTAVTFVCANGYAANETVIVAGITGFTTNNPNGTWIVTAATRTQFTATVTSAPTGSYGSGGTVNPTGSAINSNQGPAVGAIAASSYSTGGLNNVNGDTFPFRRAVVHIQQQTNGDGIQISFNGGSSFSSTYDTNGSGLITIDSGDLGSYDVRTLEVKEVAHVTGSGGAHVSVAGYVPFTTDGTSGVIGYNFGQSGAKAADYISATGWDQIWLPSIQPRRVYIGIGLNDLAVGTSLATLQTSLTTLVQRIQVATPLSEVVLCSEWHVGNHSGPYNTGITYANWYTYTNMVAGVALANNCTFIDMGSWQGDAALWAVASVTTTNGGTSATVVSGGFPDVAPGMYVQGVGIPTFPYPVTVASIAGNTVNFAGNTAAIVAGTNTLTFTNDIGLSIGDGVHFGDANFSTSGKDAHRGIAKFFWDNLTYYKALAPIAPASGWLIHKAPWTFVSATQFKIIWASDLTSIYSKGARLHWTEQGTVKYGVVGSSSFSAGVTTVNMIPTTDYAMAITPDILSSWYSYAQPPSFPSLFGFTPTFTGLTGGVFVGQWSYTNGIMEINILTAVNGTGSTTAFTMTNLPLASGQNAYSQITTATDGGSACLATTALGSSSSTATFGKNLVGGAWTASGNRGINGSFRYSSV